MMVVVLITGLPWKILIKVLELLQILEALEIGLEILDQPHQIILVHQMERVVFQATITCMLRHHHQIIHSRTIYFKANVLMFQPLVHLNYHFLSVW